MDRQNNKTVVSVDGGNVALPSWKRILDLTIIVLVLPALLMLGAAIALLIKLGSRGSIFFRQERVGYQGRGFLCYKFRTMQAGAETDTHRLYTKQLMKGQVPMKKLDAQNDPRLIPFGKLLRATGLDELPQALNIVRGDMSIVGPRPCIPYEYELYDERQRHRFDSVPGLTGLWQVNGKNNTTFDRMIELDIEYSQRRSLALDLGIIFKTFPALWRQCQELRARKFRETTAPATVISKIQSYNL